MSKTKPTQQTEPSTFAELTYALAVIRRLQKPLPAAEQDLIRRHVTCILELLRGDSASALPRFTRWLRRWKETT
jgi:hypothetical protein